MKQLSPAYLISATILIFLMSHVRAETLPLKVFVLAGQSNMQGAGAIKANPRSKNGGMGSLEYIVEAPATAEHYRHLVDKDGNWVERKDVWIWYLDRKGNLKPGFGSNPGAIGPELQFGHVVGDYFENQVLLIKCAWGGKSLGRDFRPPSAGGEVGHYYTETMRLVKEVLANIQNHFPEYDGRGYELVGFGWHQGWNDRVNQSFTEEYAENLTHLVRDLRKELGVRNLPFVIAETGMGGMEGKQGRAGDLMDAQKAGVMREEFKGTTAFVSTRPFWRTAEESPSGAGYHWNSNAETYSLIGEGIGLEMVKLLGEPNREKVRTANQKVKTKEEKAANCRKLMKENPLDYGLQATCLTEIVELLGAKAFDDVLAGLRHENAWVRRTSRQLAIGMPNSDTLKWGDYLSEEDPQLSRELIQILRTQKNSGPLLRHSFKGEDLRISALRAIHDLKDNATFEMAALATKDTNAKIRKTAFAVLVSSEAPLATETLLSLAEKADQLEPHVEAITHCFERIALGKVPEKKRSTMIDKLISIARRPEEKKLALVELQKVPSIESLTTAHALAKDSSLVEEASLAAVSIAKTMELKDDKMKKKAIAMMEEVMKLSNNKTTKDEAEKFIFKHRQPTFDFFD